MSQVFCVIDYETFSEADLKKVGGYEYSRHPSTEVICVAWRIGTRETLANAVTMVWSPQMPHQADDKELLIALADPSNILVAHNAIFEQFITKNVLKFRNIPVSRWVCTASLAGAMALPRKLENVCKALKLPVQKDMSGHRLMLKWAKPRRPSKNNPATRHTDPAELEKVMEYCKTDVDAETAIFLTLPPLSKFERSVWCLDQKINHRGFLVDRPLIQKVQKLVVAENEEIKKRIKDLTDNRVTTATQRDRILKWLENNGAFIPDLKEKTVKDTISTGLVKGPCRQLLRYRQQGSRTSTKKYWAFEASSRTDSRIRDTLVYWGASTGRWAGARIQPHNFPKGIVKNSIQAAEYLSTGDLELVRMLYGDPGLVFAGCLRNMIVAPEGKKLHVGDFNAIELRVAFWVAGHGEGLKALVEGRDLYKELASSIYGTPVARIDSSQRFVGKTAELGCIYGVGAKKFHATCIGYGQKISQQLAKKAVDTFREVNRPIVLTWRKLEMAAIAAVENPGSRYEICKTQWWVKDGYLWCHLPSGRRLAYSEPSVNYEKTPWGEKRPVLYHWGVDSKTKRWVKQKTWGGVIFENVVQAIARDLLAAAMLRIESRASWDIVFHVHDEIVAEYDLNGGGSTKKFCDLMEELPDWAVGCPVKVEGWEGERYRK